ncbi:MAG: T9SS type A sorting domain-containing protein [Bacteroidota bacterium]
MKRFNRSRFFFLFLIIFSLTFISADLASSGFPPAGYTGAEGRTCINCHGGNPLNAGGGSVVIEGLPPFYSPGATYNNISVKIIHAATDRTRWGFAMKAVANGNAIGTFSANNTNVNINTAAREVGHANAPFTNPSNTYTFSNISWTAPSNPTSAQQNITFFVSANTVGDNGYFIYASSQGISLNTTSTNDINDSPIEKINIINEIKNLNIQFLLSRNSIIKASIYTLSGQKTVTVPAKRYNAGNQTIIINGNHLPGGTYILVIENDGKTVSKKFNL